MARSHIAVALTATCLALVATLLLLQHVNPTLGPSLLAVPEESVYDGQQIINGQISDEDVASQYLLGVGKADITGPVAEINFMGYADPNQLGSGLRQRLYSRAFIIGDLEREHERVVYLVLDTQSGDTAIRQGILDELAAMGPEYAMYGQQTVAVTGTHSHSGPGAWLNYLLPQITSRGFNRDSYDAIVQGAVESIRIAHENLEPGSLSLGSTIVDNTNINRSPYAYLANPEAERNKYEDDVDKDLKLLRLQRSRDRKNIGILTWFPVHGTSMLGNNTIVTGDNKGAAAAMFESFARYDESASSNFVAGFSQANVGDTSPNVLGAYCESGPDEGRMCDFKTSLCAGKTGPCHGRGPHWGLDDAGTASTFEIGQRQYLAARSLYEEMITESDYTTLIERGPVRSLHVFVDFANRTFTLPNGTQARTCPAAMGYSFAAGTTDGPGAFDFKQHNPGDPNANPIWETVRNQLRKPGPDQIACHGVKPILLDVGETTKPYLWTPNIVDIQFLRIGSLFVIVSPGEATTMSGRRWKGALSNAAQKTFDEFASEKGLSGKPTVVLGGPANSYTHYIATPEEYDIQRYEGASTLYGPHTLDAYIDLTKQYLPYLSSSSFPSSNSSLPPTQPGLPHLSPGPNPPIHTDISLNFISPVVFDRTPFFKSFGDVLDDVKPTYTISSTAVPTISATFVAGHPRNNLRLGKTFAAVERYDESTGTWSLYRDDSNWSLLFEWKRTSGVLGTSSATISWELGWEVGIWGRQDVQRHELGSEYLSPETLTGRYRIRYFGDSKAVGGSVSGFEGVSGEFEIVT